MARSFVDAIKKIEWYADWSGPFSLLEVSMTPQVCSSALQSVFGKSFTRFLVIYHNGIASARLPHKEFQSFGKYIGAKANKDRAYARKWAKGFKEAADKVIPRICSTPEEFLKNLSQFRKPYQVYGAYNVATKTAFNYLAESAETEKELLDDARLYSETFYKDNSEMFSKVADFLSQETGYPKNLILMMTYSELCSYQKKGDLPEKEDLKKRYGCSALYFDKKGIHILSKKEVDDIEKFWLKGVSEKELNGKTAYPGKVEGVCRIVFDYKKADIKEGDILVTGMTDPHFVPLMKKVAGIITDGGGLLSHAAIVARELKKPCIIGTKVATNVLKDGDLVEVDANNGIVKIIKKAG